MKNFILILLVCSPLTLLAQDSAPADYQFAYERPGKRTMASSDTVTVIKQKQKKEVVPVAKKKVDLKQ